MTRTPDSEMEGRVRSDVNRSRRTGKLTPRLKRQLDAAIELGFAPFIEVISPRCYVELMTTSSFEMGRALKRAIRDGQFERRRRAKSRTKSGKED